MKFLSHPFWLAGFRPFFSLACASGAALPLLWALVYSGTVAAPAHATFSVFQWHAHEMFFGFGWALLGGFLLTATKNWVGIRGYHGAPLALLAALWLFDRAGMWFGGGWSYASFLFSNNAYLATIVAMLLWTLIRHRRTDSYRDDYFFIVALPMFLIAKWLLLDPEWFAAGWGMTLALFRLAFLIMLERTLTQFMKGLFQAEILRRRWLDNSIKTLTLGLVASPFVPSPVVTGAEMVLALLLLYRFAHWHPAKAMRRLDVGIMYLGYLAIVLQLALDAADRTGVVAWVGSVSVHVFTFGAMGLIGPSLIVRISKGHTGRKVLFDAADLWVLRIMLVAFILRVIAPQAFPGAYTAWIIAAAACWSVCFVVLGWRYIPMLWQPRVDGKEH